MEPQDSTSPPRLPWDSRGDSATAYSPLKHAANVKIFRPFLAEGRPGKTTRDQRSGKFRKREIQAEVTPVEVWSTQRKRARRWMPPDRVVVD
jgi:hypothetical protein